MRTRASLFSRPRRLLLSAAAALRWLGRLPAARAAAPAVRPGEPGWPDEADWQRLRAATGGALMRVESPWPAARQDPAEAERLLRALKNPYFTRDSVALTQTLGYVDAWTSQPSAWAVAARNAQEVAAAVDFARTRRVRLAVKGGGHAYQGTSSAAGSLLVWTRRMNDAAVHEDFVPEGCAGRLPPQRAVTLGAGAV